MLFDSAAHEPLMPIAWDEPRARRLITRIAADSEARFSPNAGSPTHPRDGGPGRASHGELYSGEAGVLWALHRLRAIGAASTSAIDVRAVDAALQRHHDWQASFGGTEFASYLMGDMGLLLLRHALAPSDAVADRIEALIRSNLDNPTRELMWGSPGTMLAALLLHRRTQAERWAELFRMSVRKLWSQLLWSPDHRCHYWRQELYGRQRTYLDAVHGFAGAAAPIVSGRDLLLDDEWNEWERVIENTLLRTATWHGGQANWRVFLDTPANESTRMVLQFCHGAPGFIACLANLPGPAVEALLLAAGETIWMAGPLVKGANLCHGTGGNGYAFLKLYRRTDQPVWLARARAFAMHALEQCERDADRFGQMHCSLWTGDLGFAFYLWDCIKGTALFPCLDVFDSV